MSDHSTLFLSSLIYMRPDTTIIVPTHTNACTQYKYQINIDGTVAAYRLPYLLAGGSLVLKQDSPYYEHFYQQLEPWVHYIPLYRNISDMQERVMWARENDEEAKKIATNSAMFVRHNLLPEHLYCYAIRLLKVCLLACYISVSGHVQFVTTISTVL